MKKQSIFRRVYNYFAKKWLIASIVAIIPCIIAIIDYVYNKDISLWGKIGLITLSLLSICFIILKNYGTKEDIQKCVNADRYYKVILEQAMRLKKTDASTMMKILENENPDAFFKKVHLEDRLIPKMHIERYCNKLINLLAESFGTSYDDVGISIVYKELCDAGDRSNTWQLLYNSQLDRDIDYREVINSTLSTFSAVIETPGLYYFKEKINAER
ncbi:MAG: hypothetical protein IJ040_08535, partial [Lachnospiraceae bacterium]|nr:hypothetical protein [Lachnospiraceae bacterium]